MKKRVEVSEEYRKLLSEVVTDFALHLSSSAQSASSDFLQFAIGWLRRRLTARDQLLLRDEVSLTTLGTLRSAAGSERRQAVYGSTYQESEETQPLPYYPKSEKQLDKLAHLLKGIVFFKSIEKTDLVTLIGAMQRKDIAEEEYVIVEGEEGDFFYAIEEGSFVAESNGMILKEYLDEGSFGELSLMYNVPRACSVKAISPGVVWALDRHTFQRVVLSKALQRRKLYETFIESVPLLQNMSSYERANLADVLKLETFQPGEVIIREGESAEKMYFIERGSVVVTVLEEATGVERVLNQLKEGDYFGELALIEKQPRAATVRAGSSVDGEGAGEVRLASVSVEVFERLLGPCLDIMKRHAKDYRSS